MSNKVAITSNAIVTDNGKTKSYKFTDICRLLGLNIRVERAKIARLKIKCTKVYGKGGGTYLDHNAMKKWFSNTKGVCSDTMISDKWVQTLLWDKPKTKPPARAPKPKFPNNITPMSKKTKRAKTIANTKNPAQRKVLVTRRRIVKMVQKFCEYNEGEYRKTWVKIYKRFADEHPEIDASVLWDDNRDTLDYIGSMGRITELYNLTKTMLVDEYQQLV